jgi:hypothetical protein
MNTADLFESFACKAMQTAKETDEPRERVLLLKLALDWTAVAQRSRNEAAPPPAVPAGRQRATFHPQFPEKRRNSIGEVHVASLMIRCPNTGQPISTGIETDEYSLQQIADVPARTRCSICGLDHTWWTREAWLADQLKQPVLQSSRRRRAPLGGPTPGRL